MVRWVSKTQEETEMARRGENIHKRKDGRWEGRYIKARTQEGKIQWGYVYGTVYAEVKRVLIQKKAEAGFYNLKRTDLTFEVLAEVWLHSLRNSIKESTYAHYSYTLHKYLLPVLSKVPVASLDESFLEQSMQQIISPADATHKPLGNSSARECLSMLRRICKYAAHLRLIRPMELEVSGLQSEMQEAVHRLYVNGEGDKIVTERFEVIEQVHDCRVLFEQLQASLSSSWEHYFSEASIYYAEHGDLNIPKRYTTPAGLSLGTWLITQRRVREGQIPGQLTQQQIQRLDSIGMVWGNRNEIAWQRGLESAQKYHDAHGNLMVPGKYTDPEGYPLGQWIIKTRQQRLNDRLKEERIAQLDEIGMVWSVFDVKWEKAFALAVAYYEQNGNLNMPRSYVTAAGEKLGCWVANQQWAYQKGKLSDDQIMRLERIGMYWGNRNDRQWNEGYQEAKRYFEAHGDLKVPVDYVSPGGYALGKWVKRQRYTRHNPEKSCAVLTEERIARLDAIGMRWEKNNPKRPSEQAAQAETVTAKAG